ncbi:MAG: phosphatase, partial [Dysosmobacter welbionis]
MKFAIVDLGSNTIRLSVYNTLPEGGFDLLFSEKEMAGLVSYVHGGVLSPEGIQRACGAIRDFQALLRQFDLDAPHVFATASLRNIRNTEEAVEQIRAATGVGVDVISSELEARLGYY